MGAKMMQKKVIHNSRWKKSTPGTYINRWAPYEKAHGPNQGQLPWRSLRSQDTLFPVEKCRTPPLI